MYLVSQFCFQEEDSTIDLPINLPQKKKPVGWYDKLLPEAK